MPANNVSFDGDSVFVNSERVFTVPVRSNTRRDVAVVGFWETIQTGCDSTIYVGTGHCCHGHLYVLGNPNRFNASEKGDYVLGQIAAADTNVMDIIPVNEQYVLVTGIGCNGMGVRLIGIRNPGQIVKLGSEGEFEHARRYRNGNGWPVFRLSGPTLHIDFYGLDNVQSSRSTRICSVPYSTLEITSWLAAVDITKMVKVNEGFRRIRVRG